MSAEVGGRLEAVAPHRSLFGPDYFRLMALVAVAMAVHGWLLAHTAITARDSIGYSRIAVNLSEPPLNDKGEPMPRIEVVRSAIQPPGYPVAIWGIEKSLQPFVSLSLAERSLLAAQLANAFAAVLLMIPLYLIGRILFGRNVGFGGALLFAVLPVPARITSDGLSEGMYLLAVATAILFAVRSLRQPGIGGFLLCGLATGASYLVRPEGIGVAIAAGAVICWMGLKRLWPRDQALGRLTALMVGVALVGLPYMVLIGKLSNKPTTDAMNPLNNEVAPMWKGMPQPKGITQSNRESRSSLGVTLFGTWWDPKRDAGKNREVWAMEAVWSESIKALHYAVAVLAVIGLAVNRRQLFSPDLGLWFLVVLAALCALLMFYLAERIWYVSERHTLLFVMLCCIFAASAIEPLALAVSCIPILGRLILWPQAAPGGLLLGLVVSTFPFTFQPLHPQREGHKHVGRWLAMHMADDDWLVDPFAWAEWYSGRTLHETTHYRGRQEEKVKWIVVEEGKQDGKADPHSRLPQWDLSMELKSKGQLVYRWPETPHDKIPSVCVYRVERSEQPRAIHPVDHKPHE